jgi:hypothetical protein
MHLAFNLAACVELDGQNEDDLQHASVEEEGQHEAEPLVRVGLGGLVGQLRVGYDGVVALTMSLHRDCNRLKRKHTIKRKQNGTTKTREGFTRSS